MASLPSQLRSSGKEQIVIGVPPGTLSPRAASFVRGNGLRLPSEHARQSAETWIGNGVDPAVVQRALEYEQDWGSLYLPPSMFYNGGPRYLGPDVLIGDWSARGYLEAGPARFSVPYDFLLGPDGTLGVGEVEFVPLYASVNDWIESLALEYLLRRLATETRKLKGIDIARDLPTMSPFPQIAGLYDGWLIDEERVVFVCRGMGILSNHPDDVFAVVYTGIPDREMNLS